MYGPDGSFHPPVIDRIPQYAIEQQTRYTEPPPPPPPAPPTAFQFGDLSYDNIMRMNAPEMAMDFDWVYALSLSLSNPIHNNHGPIFYLFLFWKVTDIWIVYLGLLGRSRKPRSAHGHVGHELQPLHGTTVRT